MSFHFLKRQVWFFTDVAITHELAGNQVIFAGSHQAIKPESNQSNRIQVVGWLDYLMLPFFTEKLYYPRPANRMVYSGLSKGAFPRLAGHKSARGNLAEVFLRMLEERRRRC